MLTHWLKIVSSQQPGIISVIFGIVKTRVASKNMTDTGLTNSQAFIVGLHRVKW